MSEELPPGAESAPEEPVEKPKVTRISNKPARKAAKAAKPKVEPSSEVPVEEFGSDVNPGPAQEESPEPSSEPKKKPRRRRGKGKSSSQEEEATEITEPINEETISLAPSSEEEVPEESERRNGRQPKQNKRQPKPPRRRVDLDPEQVSKKAWKIFLAEVSEEGVALIADNDARELSRRCFRLAEIFLEEQDRRTN
ncbi:MAG: hypothetical protein ACSHX7_07820 [Luteolibacter sp.]